MNKKDINKFSPNMFIIWEGKISISNPNIKKGSILPVRLSQNGKAIILDQNANTLWTPTEDLSLVMTNFIKQDIFIGTMITSNPNKKTTTAKIKIFAFYE